jgi:hypothetical protein
MYGGKNGLLRAGWEKEKRGKEKKKTKEKTGRLLVVGWGRKKTERGRKKKRPAASYLGGRKKTEREKKKKKKKAPLCTWLGAWRGKKVRGWVHGEEKKYISPAGDMGCVAGEGKKKYCRPDGCMAGQGKKIIKWNSKF